MTARLVKSLIREAFGIQYTQLVADFLQES